MILYVYRIKYITDLMINIRLTVITESKYRSPWLISYSNFKQCYFNHSMKKHNLNDNEEIYHVLRQ